VAEADHAQLLFRSRPRSNKQNFILYDYSCFHTALLAVSISLLSGFYQGSISLLSAFYQGCIRILKMYKGASSFQPSFDDKDFSLFFNKKTEFLNYLLDTAEKHIFMNK
jgi:hypothetical protein